MDILPLQFKGTTIPCPLEAGHRMVPVKHVCDALGLDYITQNRRLKKDKFWSQLYGLAPTTGADGKTYDMSCLPMFDILSWLSSIGTSNRTKESIDLLDQFKIYLRSHMLLEYQQATEVDPLLSEERKVLNIIEEKRNRLTDLRLQMRDIQDEIKGQEKRVEEIRHNRVTGQIAMELDPPND